MPGIRTFIAFDTPISFKKEMTQLQLELKKSNADVKWDTEDKFHATIKFLGNVEEAILHQVITACESSLNNFAPFDVSYQSLGSFPNKKHPRVIWIGCENRDGTLLQLKNALDASLLPFGFEIETRQFRPHITLGRVKSFKGLNNLHPILEKLNFERQDTVIQEILIMKSILRPQGSEYSILKTISLKSKK
ncbi:MAG: RNA 2',3'-cyclic phosphodiesterase [Bacteroidota bacterium]|nr:RNA 2',3'-cyclic phosphodiesterase [Bacteroidota bacterium]